MDYLPITVAVLALVNAGFTVFLVKRAGKETRGTLEALDSSLDQGLQEINQQISQVTATNSRAMGAISSVSNSVKMEKALEARIGQDMMDQALGEYGDVFEIVKATFPRVAEYVEDHPEAMVKLLPRLNTLISDPEALKRLNLQVGSQSSDISRIHASER